MILRYHTTEEGWIAWIPLNGRAIILAKGGDMADLLSYASREGYDRTKQEYPTIAWGYTRPLTLEEGKNLFPRLRGVGSPCPVFTPQ